MSAFKIGDSRFRPTLGVSGEKRPEKKDAAPSAAPPKGGCDKASIRRSPLAVMPRIGTVAGQETRRMQGGAVETLLRDSAKELDEYFTRAYGFDGDD